MMFYLKEIISVKNVETVGQLHPSLLTRAQLQQEKAATERRERMMNERIKSRKKEKLQ